MLARGIIKVVLGIGVLLTILASDVFFSIASARPLVEEAFGTVIHAMGRSPEDLDRRMDALQATGVKLLRENMLWHEIETRPGEFDFSRADRMVEAAAKRGIEMIAILCYGNPLYADADDSIFHSKTDAALFGRFAAKAAERYHGRIRYFEVWNEPNAYMRFFKANNPHTAARRYAELLAQAYTGIKAANPDAKVILGGLFQPNWGFGGAQLFAGLPGGFKFLQMLRKSDPAIGRSMDIIGWHPYRYPQTAPESKTAFQSTMSSSLRRLQAEWGKPVFITEMGYHTAKTWFPMTDGVSLDEQAQYLVRTFLLSLAAGVDRFIWYQFTEGGDHPFEFENSFGIMSEDMAATKPSHQALRFMLCLLGKTKLKTSRERREISLQSFTFEDASREYQVHWNHSEPGAPGNGRWLLPVPANFRAYDLYGNIMPGEGLKPDGRPIYLVEGALPEACSG